MVLVLSKHAKQSPQVCIECYAVPFMLFLISFISTPVLRVLVKLPGVLGFFQKWASHLLPEDLKKKPLAPPTAEAVVQENSENSTGTAQTQQEASVAKQGKKVQ